jgi:hypothetical protein
MKSSWENPMKSRRVSAPALWFQPLLALPIVLAATCSAAAEPGSFGEAIDAARRSAGGAGAFREAVSGWVEGKVAPPLAFRLGDQTQAGVLARSRRTHATRPGPAGVVHTISYADPTTGLLCRVELLEFQDFPAVEWVAHFTNQGTAALPPLAEVLASDLARHTAGDAFVYRAPGANETPCDF